MTQLHERIMKADIGGINSTLKEFGVNAGVPNKTVDVARKHSLVALSSHCAYHVRTGPGVRFSEVERLQREMQSKVAERRMRIGLPARLSLRISVKPQLIVEIDTPSDKALDLPGRRIALPDHQGVIGESFTFQHGRKAEALRLGKHLHTGIFAMSGHGKSTILRAFLLTMLYNTSPEHLRILAIDLKNDDLLFLKNLPHTMRFAGDLESAIAAIDYANEVKRQRIESDQTIFDWRLLVVVDELAELNDGVNEAKPESVRHKLASTMKTGRSLGIHVVAATQYPSAKEIGSVVARSFTHRIVGKVDGATSAQFAAGRPGTGAELLRRPGSFLRIGDDIQRFQAYYTESKTEEGMALIERWCGTIRGRWRDVQVQRPQVERKPQKQERRAPALPPALVQLMREYDEGEGNMRRGFMTRAVTLLNGGEEPNGNTFRRLKGEVEQYLNRYRTLTYSGSHAISSEIGQKERDSECQ